MIYGSVCSGIEAATVAWHPLGWRPAFFSEIEKFPRAVLAHHYPDVPLHGDFTTIGADEYGPIDLLVGGTPCQSFSIAGLRKGLEDDRGNLALEFILLAKRKKPRWIVWENVPGVLSSNGGGDFGTFLGALGELGYGFAYRILDAQHFGVPQRRRRVFVVGYLGDWRRAAAVLFERHSLSGHPAPRREKGKAVTGYTAGSFGDYREGCGSLRAQGGDYGGGTETIVASTGNVAHCLNAGGMGRQDYETETMIIDTLTSNGDAHSGYRDEKGHVAFSIMPMNSGKDYKARETDVAQPIMAGGPVGGNQGGDFVCAFSENQQGAVWESDTVQALNKGGGKPGQGYAAIRAAHAVRRLTPRECERLQGFPDDYTLIPWRGKAPADCPDGPRYKALGNSMSVPVMRWIGERIQMVDVIGGGNP